MAHVWVDTYHFVIVCAVYSENYQYNCDSKKLDSNVRMKLSRFQDLIGSTKCFIVKKTFFGEIIFETFKDFIGAQNAKNFKSQFLWTSFEIISIKNYDCNCNSNFD